MSLIAIFEFLRNNSFLDITTVMVSMTFVYIVMVRYLRTEQERKQLQEIHFSEMILKNKSKFVLTANQIDEIADKLKTKVNKKIGEQILSDVKRKYSVEAKRESIFGSVKKQQGEMVDRITDEIDELRKRSTRNLAIGMTFSLVGIGILGVSGLLLYNGNSSGVSPNEVISYFFPRLSLAVFIELFAYFFLRLYKIDLDEIKYFQNELTNIEMKFMAFLISVNYLGKKELAETTKQFSCVERNFVLKKGESTMGLESAKTENRFLKELLTVFDVFKNKK